MRRHTLLNAVAALVGRESPEQSAPTPIQMTPDKPLDIDEARELGRLILLADDNQTNRKVISQQLSMLGYLAEVAEDGAVALEMWRNSDYDMLLTDCHMPEMDGYQLSETIRSEEPEGMHKPIIAITADALKGAAQKCFAAGMDGYLTKPLQLHQMREALEKWLPSGAVPEETPKEQAATQAEDLSDETIDPQALGNLLGTQERGVLAGYYLDFLESSTPTVEQIQDAFRQSDLPEMSSLAHKLKSSARTVGANTLADCCQALETSGKDGDADEVVRQIEILPDLFRGVKQWIDDHCKTE